LHTLQVEGSPREMGLQHGEVMREPIRELAAIRYDLLRRRMPGWSASAISDLALEQLSVLARHADAREEFSGIAEASGLTSEALVILNNYTDMRDFQSPDEGCSTFAVRDESRYVCGQTWDMHASARPYVMHLSKPGPDGAEILTLTGCMAIAGINRHNIAVLINNMNCSETATNLMWPALVRGMLACRTETQAAAFLNAHLPCSGHNYLLCGNDAMMNFESTGQQLDLTFRASYGSVFHTNHYLGRLAEYEVLEKRSATSIPRYAALEEFFSDSAATTGDLDLIAQRLCSKGVAGNVCVPFSGPDASLTCGGMLVDVAAGRGIMFAGTFDEGEHSTFYLPGPAPFTSGSSFDRRRA
jgi:isopenicillin-N N-acyltransferase-like protein